MGNKEFRDGFFSVKDGITLLKFPTMDEVRAVFLLYHMKSIPKAIKHMPVTISKVKSVWVTMKRDSLKSFIKNIHGHGW